MVTVLTDCKMQMEAVKISEKKCEFCKHFMAKTSRRKPGI